MQLSSLLDKVNVTETFQAKDIEVTGVSYHSQKVEKGHVFVCVTGFKTDGHKYLQSAVDQGAKAAIVERINPEIDIAQYVVENSRIALAQISAMFYGNPSEKLKMIGITATNGKTTTAFMTEAILKNHGYKTGLIGTVSVKFGDQVIPAELTTPESLELQKYFKEMDEHDVTHAIMEVSSAAQEMYRVKDVDYDIVTLNNINREHIDTHGSFENYVEKKTQLIRYAKQGSVAILNLDCDYTEALMQETKATPITFGIENQTGDLAVKNLDLSTGRAKFTVEVRRNIEVFDQKIHKGSFEIALSIPGLHSVSNSMVAIIIALINGVSVETIQKTMQTFVGVERRFEFIYEEGPIIVDDHFANPGNIDVTLETLHFMKYNQLHLLYAIRGQRGPVVNEENGETVVKWAKKLGLKEIIVTKSVSDVTAYDEATEEETAAFVNMMQANHIKVIMFDELSDAIQESLTRAQADDLILLAGCQGMDNGASIVFKQLEMVSS